MIKLLKNKQTEKYQADHSTAVLMEVGTGKIRAISNFGRTNEGKYFEKLNYAIGESIETGSTFKLMSMIAALEDQVIDTLQLIDTEKGEIEQLHSQLRATGIQVGSLHDHRDGTASFYLRDPDGNWLEMLYHPPAGIPSNQ